MDSVCPNQDIRLLLTLPLVSKTILSTSGLVSLGHTKSQLLIFSALYLEGNLTMSQTADFLSSSKEQATRAVAPLVEEGLVERYVDPENRTRVRIRLTEQGRAFVRQHYRHCSQRLETVLNERISPEEKQELFRAAETLIRILDKLS